MTKSNRFLSSAIAVPLAAALSLPVAACGGDGEPAGPAGEVVELPGPDFYPEGVAVARDGTTYVASIITGAIVKIPRGARVAEAFVAAGVTGASTVGLYAGSDEDLLWLCVGTYGTDLPPAVAGVDLERGVEVVRHGFPPQSDGSAGGLCNEITEDGDGNLYATDSFGARVLRVAAGAKRTPGAMTVWAQGPELAPAPMGFGANGLAYDGRGGLLAVNTSTGAMVRMAIGEDGAAGAIEAVALPRALVGPDGLRLVDDGVVVVVEQYAGALTRVELDAEPVVMTELRTGLRGPTSLDVTDEAAWVSEGQLSHVFDGTQPELPFTVVRVALEP